MFQAFLVHEKMGLCELMVHAYGLHFLFSRAQCEMLFLFSRAQCQMLFLFSRAQCEMLSLGLPEVQFVLWFPPLSLNWLSWHRLNTLDSSMKFSFLFAIYSQLLFICCLLNVVKHLNFAIFNRGCLSVFFLAIVDFLKFYIFGQELFKDMIFHVSMTWN